MKAVLIPLGLVALLSGCVGYVDPGYGYGYGQPAVSATISSGPAYNNGGYHRRGDRDGDGVPNRYDSRPNNPYRN